ncbi:voltage-gated potassium channel KCNC4-like isoform X2 [Clytia hemisphaerica]|uniref:voltage-gated potassium channel KCNC4-like isoform X2 n=1 Tax=Clytia hemisphaerica TaxID=252671 RepID=UPI0034D5977A
MVCSVENTTQDLNHLDFASHHNACVKSYSDGYNNDNTQAKFLSEAVLTQNIEDDTHIPPDSFKDELSSLNSFRDSPSVQSNYLQIKREPLSRTRSDGILSLKKKWTDSLLEDRKTSLNDITLENIHFSDRMRKRRAGLSSTLSLSSSVRRSRSSLRGPIERQDSLVSTNQNMELELQSRCESPVLNDDETLSTCENASGRPLGSQSIRGNGANEKSADRIVINVGGTRHETFRSTLRVYPDTRLGWLSIDGSDVSDAFDPVLNEYFFDRHPTAFNQIMNFYRTGKLHTPADICGPLFEEELNFWGLDEKAMEPCCWPKYTEHRDAQENLKVFDSPLLNNQHDDDEIEQPAISVSRIPNYKEPEDQGFKSRFLKVFRPSYFNSIRWLSKKKLIWAVMEGHSERRPMLSKGVGFISLMFIVLSVLSLFFHSMLLVISDKAESNHELFTYLLLALDYLTFAWMSIELIIRFVSSPNRIQFLISFYTIVDLLTLITYALQFNHGMDYHRTKDGVIDSNSITTDYKNIEMFSIVRLVRLVRFFRLSVGLQIFKHTIIASSRELLLLVLLLLLPVALFATIVYFFERETNTGKFRTIPESIWWAVITITTVGYGDMSPETTWGKIFGIICAVFSVFILALPVSIIGTNFTLFYNYAQARMKLPKRPKLALVGAANALRADTSQHSLSPEPGESEAEGGDTNSQDGEEAAPKIDLPKINLGSDPDFNANITSKRFRRERLSLFASGPTRQSTRRSKSVGNSVASKIRQRQRNGTSASQKSKGSTPSSEDEVSEAESEKIEVFKPVKRDNDNSVTNSFDNEAFEHNNEKQVEVATEVTENGHTNQNKKIINNTENDKETKDLNSKFQKPFDDEKRERLPPINGGPVPIIETILTNTDNTDQNLTTGPIVNGHGPPILKEPVMNNRNSFKKISSPPVLRKICGNGLEPVRKSNGMAVPVEEVESPELFRRKYSNNHLYVPTDGC